MSSLERLIIQAILALFPRSTEDWKVGDLAVCIDDPVPPQFRIAGTPSPGDLLRVTEVCMDGLFLHFEGKPADRHWGAIFFRKPLEDTDKAAEAEWVEKLKRQRAKEPA